MVNKRLHNQSGPSIEYRDGFSVHSLNGVRVPSWVVRQKKEEFTKEQVLGEKNVEIRREIIRKIGIEEVSKWGEVLDKKWGYELLDLKLDGKTPYLKMRNPSIDAWHLEGVPPDIETVKGALVWRNGTNRYVKPLVLT